MSTLFSMALRLASGEIVTPAEARKLLHADFDRQDAARLERCDRIRCRNQALREAAGELGAGIGAWALAERLEAAVLRFESRIWPRLKAGFECELSPSDECLYRAFLTGQHVPRTQRRLYDLVT